MTYEATGAVLIAAGATIALVELGGRQVVQVLEAAFGRVSSRSASLVACYRELLLRSAFGNAYPWRTVNGRVRAVVEMTARGGEFYTFWLAGVLSLGLLILFLSPDAFGATVFGRVEAGEWPVRFDRPWTAGTTVGGVAGLLIAHPSFGAGYTIRSDAGGRAKGLLIQVVSTVLAAVIFLFVPEANLVLLPFQLGFLPLAAGGLRKVPDFLDWKDRNGGKSIFTIAGALVGLAGAWLIALARLLNA